MSEQVPNLRGGPGAWVVFIVGPLFALIVAGAGFVWQAAKYPDRSEFRSATNDLTSVKQDVAIARYRLDGVEKSQAELKVSTDEILKELRNRRR